MRLRLQTTQVTRMLACTEQCCREHLNHKKCVTMFQSMISLQWPLMGTSMWDNRNVGPSQVFSKPQLLKAGVAYPENCLQHERKTIRTAEIEHGSQPACDSWAAFICMIPVRMQSGHLLTARTRDLEDVLSSTPC